MLDWRSLDLSTLTPMQKCVRSTLISTQSGGRSNLFLKQNYVRLALNALSFCKLYAKINAKLEMVHAKFNGNVCKIG